MDLLSMTASIVAVVGAGSTIGKRLTNILSLRHASEVFLALNNEVSDLKCVVLELRKLLESLAETMVLAPPQSLCQALHRSSRTLSKLEHFVSYELTTIKGKTN